MFKLRLEDPDYLSRWENLAGRVTPQPVSPNLRRAPIKPTGQHTLPLKTGTVSNCFPVKGTKLETDGLWQRHKSPGEGRIRGLCGLLWIVAIQLVLTNKQHQSSEYLYVKKDGKERFYLVNEFWHKTELCETEGFGEKMDGRRCNRKMLKR